MANAFDEKVAAKSASQLKGGIFFAICMVLAAIGVAWGASPIKPVAFNLKPMGDVKWLDTLGKGSRMFEGAIIGPASMAFKRYEEMAPEDEEATAEEEEGSVKFAPRMGEYMFTGLSNGSLVQVNMATGAVETVLKTIGDDAKYLSNGWKCGDKMTERLCGRTMGLAFDQDRLRLYILDAFKGLYSVDLEERAKVKLADEDPDGNPFNYLHGVAVSRHTGMVYFTEPSRNLKQTSLRAGVLDSSGGGRLYQFDPVEGIVKTLISNLNFPTGVTILENKEGSADASVLIAEPGRARIRRYNIPSKKGKKGTVGTFTDNLPGLPMSLQWDQKKDTLLVGCEARPAFYSTLAAQPHLRRFLATIQGWAYELVFPRRPAVLVLSRKGKVVKALSDPTPKSNGMVSATAYKGDLYLGFDSESFITKVPKF